MFHIEGPGAERLRVAVISLAISELKVVLPPVLEDLELSSGDRLRVINDKPLYQLAAWRSGQ